MFPPVTTCPESCAAASSGRRSIQRRVRPSGPECSPLTTGQSVDGGVALDTGNIPKAH